jgi:hypothetical protein
LEFEKIKYAFLIVKATYKIPRKFPRQSPTNSMPIMISDPGTGAESTSGAAGAAGPAAQQDQQPSVLTRFSSLASGVASGLFGDKGKTKRDLFGEDDSDEDTANSQLQGLMFSNNSKRMIVYY